MFKYVDLKTSMVFLGHEEAEVIMEPVVDELVETMEPAADAAVNDVSMPDDAGTEDEIDADNGGGGCGCCIL